MRETVCLMVFIGVFCAPLFRGWLQFVVSLAVAWTAVWLYLVFVARREK